MQRQQTVIREIAELACVLLRYAVAVAALLIVNEAGAQINGSISIVSDYRFRGVSLSAGHPEPQVHLGYDSRSGWYAGGFASGTDLKEEKGGNAQLMAYAGYAGQRTSGVGWEVGAIKSIFLQAASYDYVEVFAGLASDRISSRLYFSPDYFDRHASTLYAEFNGTYPLGQRFHLLGHIGFLKVLSKQGSLSASAENQSDISAGASANLADWKIRLVWIAGKKNNEESRFYGNSHTWMMNASYSF